ncbi:MAG: hypothetical protein KAI07_05275, partial [Deltaproteobacteria bacterium]|nr:hypothetical protein [Deltaproteobacteria bacterium]
MVKNPNLSEEELVGRSIKAINTLLNKYQLRECFHKDDKCSSKIIEAHSIQRNRVLKNISDDGHIMMFQMITNNKEAKWKPEERGLNKATVFSGFCEYHERKIFKPIDLYDYEEDNEEQEFLFAYRALAK